MTKRLVTVNPDHHGLDNDLQETVLILQEEIARLEEELRLFQDQPSVETPRVLPRDEPGVSHDVTQVVADLEADLARRDETIAVLMEQVRALEESQVAVRDEWDQLEGWVQEVDRRADGRDPEDRNLQRSLVEELREARQQRRAIEAERAAWTAERLDLSHKVEALQERLRQGPRQTDPEVQNRLRATEQELAHLRETLATERSAAEADRRDFREEIEELRAQQKASPAPPPAHSMADAEIIVALEQENERLRNERRALRESAETADASHADLVALRVRLARAEDELARAQDDLLRERHEHELALAELRNELANEIQRRPESAETLRPPSPSGTFDGMAVEERMWAFRKHLQEVHQQEVEVSRHRKLSARLSRMFKKGRPGSRS